jgi:hypothetical protein
LENHDEEGNWLICDSNILIVYFYSTWPPEDIIINTDHHETIKCHIIAGVLIISGKYCNDCRIGE